MGWMVKVEYEPEHEVIEESYLCRSVGDLDETLDWLKQESEHAKVMRVTRVSRDDGSSKVLYDSTVGLEW